MALTRFEMAQGIKRVARLLCGRREFEEEEKLLSQIWFDLTQDVVLPPIGWEVVPAIVMDSIATEDRAVFFRKEEKRCSASTP